MALESNRQITLYYDSTSKLGKQAYADAQATKAAVLPLDVTSEKVSGTTWIRLAKKLDLDVGELINQDHPVFKNLYGNEKVDLSVEDILKVLEKHPETLVYPIAVRGDKAILVKQSTDMRKLKYPDSKGTNLRMS